MVLTNELPRLTDASGALASRFIILVLKKSFYGREDLGLTERLSGELPGILNWAITGWDRLQKRGRFVPPASSDQAQAELEDLGSPIGAFLRDRCVINPSREVECEQLFKHWRDWCRKNNREHAGSTQTFARDLHTAVPGLTITRPHGQDGKPCAATRVWAFSRLIDQHRIGVHEESPGPRWSAVPPQCFLYINYHFHYTYETIFQRTMRWDADHRGPTDRRRYRDYRRLSHARGRDRVGVQKRAAFGAARGNNAEFDGVALS